MNMEDNEMTIKDLYEALKPLVEEFGDLKVLISYDSGYVSTPIKKIPPAIKKQPMKQYSKVIFEGY